MQKEFLEGLGIVDVTVIDKIMAENSADIKKIEAERDNYKTQLDTAQNTLKEFDGVNVKDMQDKIKTLTDDLCY